MGEGGGVLWSVGIGCGCEWMGRNVVGLKLRSRSGLGLRRFYWIRCRKGRGFLSGMLNWC